MSSRTDSTSSAAIIGDKSCIYCGASLRGVSSLDNCPNCGRLAGYSLLGDHLRDAESTWTRKMMLGIAVMMGANFVIAAWYIVQIIAIADPKSDVIETAFIKLFLFLAGWLAFLIGAGMLAQPETSGSLLSRRRGVAMTLLWSTILYFGLSIIPKSYFLQIGTANVLIAKFAISSLALVVSQSVLWIHLRRIIDRTPRRELSRLLTVAFWVSLPLNLLLCEGAFVLLGKIKLHDRAVFYSTIGLLVLGILQRFGAVALLMMTRKGIRRTVGYWDN